MRAEEIVVQVRDKELVRQGAILPKDLNLSAVVRFNDVGEWKLTLPRSHPMASALFAPGSGISVDMRGERIFSGPTWQPARQTDQTNAPDGTFTFVGYTDDILLRNARAWPEPSNPDPTTQAVANDVREGYAETIMREYVSANIGPDAPTERRSLLAQKLVLATDELRGPSDAKASPRFATLLATLQEIALYAGLGFQVIQRGSTLQFEVITLHDRSRTVRLDIDSGTLASEESTVSPPELTRAIVAGQGEGVDRVIVQRTSAEGTTAEGEWGQIIEEFIDARGTADTGELEQKGDARLTEAGFTAVAVKVKPSDLTMRYPEEWRVGERVGIIVKGQPRTAIATAAAFIVGPGQVSVGMSLGDTSTLSREASTISRVSDTERRVSNLEQTEAAGGSALTLGEPLYFDAGTLKIRDASTTQRGSVELATDAETQAGTDTERAVTPASLASRTATDTRQGIVELATGAEVITGTDTDRAVTPAGLAGLTATSSRRGIVELATDAEATTGTDTDRAVTPAALTAAMDARFDDAYRYLGRVIFTAGGTFSKGSYPLATHVIVKAQGGGGGGGGCTAAASGQHSKGSGGGAGEYVESDLIAVSSLATNETVTIGAAGSTTSGAGGGSGGSTSLGSTVIANGGSGGATAAVSAAAGFGVEGGDGGSGGTAPSGGISIPGGAGHHGTGSATLSAGGNGGDSVMGRGGKGRAAAASNSSLRGGTAGGYGAGGGGSASNSVSGGAQQGGIAAPGILIVELWRKL